MTIRPEIKLHLPFWHGHDFIRHSVSVPYYPTFCYVRIPCTVRPSVQYVQVIDTPKLLICPKSTVEDFYGCEVHARGVFLGVKSMLGCLLEYDLPYVGNWHRLGRNCRSQKPGILDAARMTKAWVSVTID